MLIQIPDILSGEQVSECRRLLDQAQWVDGNVTSGYQSAQAKHNRQLPEGAPAARQVGGAILDALERNPLFIAAALPLKVFPPLFNRYGLGETFDFHVDNAIRTLRGTDFRIRTDLSATLFFSAPDEYDGGELIIEDTYGAHAVKLPAGHMVLYPSTSLHKVNPVTRGERVAAFFWIQSLVREDSQRTLLFDLDTAIQKLNRDVPEHEAVVQLTGVYHNLLRRWADT